MFPYHGSIQQLTKDLASIRPRLKSAYRHVLGKRLFEIVEEADRLYLGPESFQSEEFLLGRGVAPQQVSNRFLFATSWERDPEFQPDGSFAVEPVKTAPGFVLSEAAFARTSSRYEGWISPYLGPYFHEYDHFVIWAIQRHPLALASTILSSLVKPTKLPVRPIDVPDLVMASQGTRQERALLAAMAVWSVVLDSVYEVSTRRLDLAVFERLGFTPDDSYRNFSPKSFVPLPIPIEPGVEYEALSGLTFPPINAIDSWIALAPELTRRGFMLNIVADGDLYYGMPLADRLRYLTEWAERLKPSHPSQSAFIKSFKQLSVEKMSLARLIAEK